MGKKNKWIEIKAKDVKPGMRIKTKKEGTQHRVRTVFLGPNPFGSITTYSVRIIVTDAVPFMFGFFGLVQPTRKFWVRRKDVE